VKPIYLKAFWYFCKRPGIFEDYRRFEIDLYCTNISGLSFLYSGMIIAIVSVLGIMPVSICIAIVHELF